MSVKPWKVIKSEDISPSKWFPLFKDHIITPKGVEVTDYYRSKFKEGAIILPILKSGKIVFVQQYKHGVGTITLECPAGFIEEGDTPADTALRELSEECGINVQRNDLEYLGAIYNCTTKLYLKLHLFVAKNCEFNGHQNLDPNEEIELVTMKFSKAIEEIPAKINTAETIAILQAYNSSLLKQKNLNN